MERGKKRWIIERKPCSIAHSPFVGIGSALNRIQDQNLTLNAITRNVLNKAYLMVPSNAHISTPFFQKTVFFSKIFFGKPPSNFLEVCLNSEYM